jgi:hypothetical protein
LAAITGQNVTRTDTLKSFDRPFLNDSGQLAFETASQGACGVRDCPALVNMVAIEKVVGVPNYVVQSNAVAPGVLDGFKFADFYLDAFNTSGQAVFVAVLTPQVNQTGVWITDSNSQTRLVARQGMHPPNTAPGTVLHAIGDSSFDYNSLPLTSTGVTAFFTSTDSPAWIGSSFDDLHILFASGDSVPTLGPPITFSRLGQPRLNENGGIAFWGEFGGPSISDANNRALFRGTEQSGFSIIAREGDQAPGLPANTRFSLLESASLHTNRNLDTIFHAFANLPNAPNENSTEGIWLSRMNGPLSLVAAAGSVLPGMGPGETVEGFLGNQFINDLGEVGFRARVNGPLETASNDEGIWILDPSGNLRLAIREGQMINVGTASLPDLRTVISIGGGDSRTLNATGEFAFQVAFSDGTQGVFVSSVAAVPEPTEFSCVASGFAVFAILIHFRRTSRPILISHA